MVQCESEIDQQRRKSHEDAAAAKPYPGRHGPTVFMWTDDDNHGFLLRTRVPQGKVNNFWDEFTDSQKRFNSFKNEWDLCEEFDPKALSWYIPQSSMSLQTLAPTSNGPTHFQCFRIDL